MRETFGARYIRLFHVVLYPDPNVHKHYRKHYCLHVVLMKKLKQVVISFFMRKLVAYRKESISGVKRSQIIRENVRCFLCVKYRTITFSDPCFVPFYYCHQLSHRE